MVVDRTFLKGHIFVQIFLLAVTYDSNNNQILLSYATVTSKTEDNWMWFIRQLEIDFPGSYVLVADYTRGLRVINSKVISEILDAYLHNA